MMEVAALHIIFAKFSKRVSLSPPQLFQLWRRRKAKCCGGVAPMIFIEQDCRAAAQNGKG